MNNEEVLLETQHDLMVVNDNGIEIIAKHYAVYEEYTPLDNTLDESTKHYLRCKKSWGYSRYFKFR